MKTLDTIKHMGDRLQIALVVGSVPKDVSSGISIIYANDLASNLFGYDSGEDLVGEDVRSLTSPETSRTHIVGEWRNIKGVRLDGSMVDLQANVADIRSDQERYFVAIFRDRTEEVSLERELKEAVNSALLARSEAEDSAKEAKEAKSKAEAALQKQDDLTKQVNLLLTNLTSFRPQNQETAILSKGETRRQWLATSFFVAALMIGGFMAESIEGVPITLVERVLLVLAGVLGTTIASSFERREPPVGPGGLGC